MAETLRLVRFKGRIADQVLPAPLDHRRQDGQQALAERGQAVLYLGRHDLIVGPFDQPKSRKGFQLAAQHPGRDFLAAIDIA